MTYDVLIGNGSVIDGTGEPAPRRDVAAIDGAIVRDWSKIARVSSSTLRARFERSRCSGCSREGDERWS